MDGNGDEEVHFNVKTNPFHTDVLFFRLLFQTNLRMSNKAIHSFHHLNSQTSVKVGDTNRNETLGFTHHFRSLSLKNQRDSEKYLTFQHLDTEIN